MSGLGVGWVPDRSSGCSENLAFHPGGRRGQGRVLLRTQGRAVCCSGPRAGQGAAQDPGQSRVLLRAPASVFASFVLRHEVSEDLMVTGAALTLRGCSGRSAFTEAEGRVEAK